jgi:hypothetical protein
MKKIYLMAVIPVFLVLMANRLQAQASMTNLNQVEQIKRFTGKWRGDEGKDTTVFWEIKSSGSGIDCSFRFVTKGNLIIEGKQFWGYDTKTDKFIMSSTTEGMDSGTSGLWFVSKNKCIITDINNLSSPEKAPFKIETEFKSPDMFVQTTIVNSKIIKTVAYNRVKD